MELLERVRRYVAAHGLLADGDGLVVGVSGGPDSLALIHMLCALRDELALDIHVAHVHHGLRGDEAEADAAFVQEMARTWELPVTIGRADVNALVAARKMSVEEAARQARYTHLAEIAVSVGATRIAVGHNADDQAETVLMHFLRGSGLAGLRGMLPSTRLGDYHLLEPMAAGTQLDLIRPLLATPRADIEAYCETHGLVPRFDRSNLDRTHFRNRLRHEVLPLLASLNPNVREVLRRSADVLAADYEVLEREVDAAWEACLQTSDDSMVRFNLVCWRELPLALQRGTLRRAVWQLRRSLRDVTFVQVQDAVRVAAAGRTGAQATLPGGLALHVGYEDITISAMGASLTSSEGPSLASGVALRLDVPGEIVLSDGWRLSIVPYDGARRGPEWEALLADRWATPLAADRLGGEVVLRTRQLGDRFRPHGLGGTQTIADFMVNAKIPANWREQTPLLVTNQAIAWIVGWRVDERFVVSDSTERVVVARFIPDVPDGT